VQTTERYLGCKQNLGHPVNDLFDLRTDGQQQAKHVESVPADGASEAVEKACGQGIECGHGGSEHEQPIGDPKHVSLPERADVSKSEKAIARTAFDAALKRELQDVMRKTKQMAMANQIKEPADVWELEHYLTERRKEMDRKYDYRYSQLTQVFGRLLYEKRLGEEALGGLREDKLKSIRSFAKFLAEDTAA
jgi:Photoprotection regulator fluorescence recovery protein